MRIKIPSIIMALLMAPAILQAGDVSGEGAQTAEVDEAISTQSGLIAVKEPSAAISGNDNIIVFKLAGDGQKAPAGQWTPASLEVGTWKETGPEPLVNVPVDFSLVEGGGWLAKTPGFDAGASVRILTDDDGIAQVWHRQPDQANIQSIITASALGKSVTFTTYSITPAAETPSANASGPNPAPANASPSAAPETTTEPLARPSQKEMLKSLATAHGTRRAGASASKTGQQGGAPEATRKSLSGSILPDEYFAYPASHPLGRMQRGMVLYAAAGKARELRDTEQSLLLAAEAKDWLLLALESEGEMSQASAARCHYYLGKIAERYNGNQTAALQHYRTAGEKDATRKQATAAVERIKRVRK